MGGGGEVAFCAGAVEESHHALDHRDVRARGHTSPVPEQRHDALLADQPRVEVAPGAPRGHGVIARVDVVRADLVW